jgi:hypothetical protein
VPLEAAEDPGLRIAVGVCAILFGWLGVHHFLLGRVALGLPSLLLGSLGFVVLILSLLTGCPGLICLFLPLLVFTWGQSIYTGVCYLRMSDQQFAILASSPEEKRRVPTLWIATFVYAGFLVIGLVLIVLLVLRRLGVMD